ncbi:MAG: SDR family NAD(P)-dependent oxidoreductase [Acidimicrobiia bacterium]|nr:SDR family NAD(P)-dependent oxidoreductase [Acidimicrobiia bacterium]
MDLSDKVIVVTGASRGLGAGMAEWFAAQGAALGLCARHEPGGPAGARVVSAAVDVTDPAALDAFAERVDAELGAIDLWINNAGVLEPVVRQRDLAPADLARHLEINVTGVVSGTQAFLRSLDRRDARGVLVNISSGASQRGMPGWSAYCAGKAAVDRLTEVVAIEEPERLRAAWSVSPGLIDTDMQSFIRTQSAEVMPNVEWFKERKATGAMNAPAWVAEHVARWAWVEGEAPPKVVAHIPEQPS